MDVYLQMQSTVLALEVDVGPVGSGAFLMADELKAARAKVAD